MSALAAVQARPDAGRPRPASTSAESGGADFEAVLASVAGGPAAPQEAEFAPPDVASETPAAPAVAPAVPLVVEPAPAQLRPPVPVLRAAPVAEAQVLTAAAAVEGLQAPPPTTTVDAVDAADAPTPPSPQPTQATAAHDRPGGTAAAPQPELRATPQALAERALSAAVVVHQPVSEPAAVAPLQVPVAVLADVPADVVQPPSGVAATVASTAVPLTAPPVVEAAAPAPPAPAAPPAPVVQVATAVAPLLEGPDGAYTMSLQLYPEELGAVQVEVSLRGGEISLALNAPDEAAREVLRAALPELRAHLESGGLTATGVFVGDGRTGEKAHGGGGSAPGTRSGDGTGGAPADEPTAEPSASDSALDVRI
jgi:hypothetical protein